MATTHTRLTPAEDFHALNAMLNLFDAQGNIPFEKDLQAAECYTRDYIASRTVKFSGITERLRFLVDEGYYEADVFNQYPFSFVTGLHQQAENAGHHFTTFLGALKFYQSYALKTFDGNQYLENFSQRCCMVALTLARGDQPLATEILQDIIHGRFQPATPTFLNCGKQQRGEFVSCFLLRIEDNMESIGRSVNSALQLSRRGGGVAFCLSNLREQGAPIKKIAHQSSGVIPVMKMLEDAFSYANQLGARQGAGAVWLHAHHPDILHFLDTKRENADEKIRIKTLSLGVVLPDITFHLARENQSMALFSPYDVERVCGKAFADISINDHYDEFVADERIKKTWISARALFQTLAAIQFESGYPYLMFEDTVNRQNPLAGRINMSNLCSEILQVNQPSEYREDLSYSLVGKDISCNLGSLNIARVMDAGHPEHTVNVAIRALTSVADMSDMQSVPSIAAGNRASHAIGLGQMNLHGYLARENIMYGSAEALDFTNLYFYSIAYYALKASCEIARERQQRFSGFEHSSYASGEFFDKYIDQQWLPRTIRGASLFSQSGITLPCREDWQRLRQQVMTHGLYHSNLQAVPPTGSISYINHATSSIHPIAAKIEIRKEGKLGRVYYPAPYLTNANQAFYADAYQIGPQAIIDTYAEATQHVDQGLSLTLFFNADATTRDINKAQIYAWKKGIKTLYYIRLRQAALKGTELQGCVACAL